MVVMANTRLRDASERITTYQLGAHFARLSLPPHSWAGDGLLAICSLLPASSSSESWSPVTCGTGAASTSRGAFALAVLAVVGSHLPSALRAFLVALAAAEDLIATAIIADAGFTATIPRLFAPGYASSSWVSSSSRAG